MCFPSMEPGFDSRRPHQPQPLNKMKMLKSLLAFASVSLFAVGLALAADAKKEAPAPKVAACCATAAKDGKTCTHSCCIDAAKAGNNCTTCGGSGALAKKAPDKK